MARVYVSSVLNATVSSVWNRIRDFNGLSRWHPTIRDSKIEDGNPSDKVGCIRNFHLQNGDQIREQLLALSDYDYFYTYSILESPMPLSDYIATIRLTPITEIDGSFIEWTAEFDCEAADAEDLINTIGQNVFQAGFDSLKRHFDA